jgi:hypothetical protein
VVVLPEKVLRTFPGWVRTSLRSSDSEEAADRLAGYAEADDLAGGIDVGDRVGRDQAAVAREEAGANREGVGDVGERSVHRTLDLADHSTAVVRHQETGRVHEIQRECGHGPNLFLVCKEIPLRAVRVV